jgi:N-acetylglucosamine malate deacetylase 1
MESQFASGLLESESPQNSGGAMKIDLLAIAAHPDDVELTSGGTLLKMAAEGYATGILDLTRGETGTRGTPETRLKEAQTAAKILKVQVRRNLGLPDARLKVCDEYKQAIAEVIRELQPRTVILPYWDGRHPDHNAAAALGYEACFIAGLKNYPMAGEAFRPFKILYAAAYEGARPTFAVDISKYYLRRRDAILAYKSQFSPPKRERSGKVYLPLDELEERMSLQAKHYGRMIGVQYAEAYIAKEIMEVNDVVSLPVRSM